MRNKTLKLSNRQLVELRKQLVTELPIKNYNNKIINKDMLKAIKCLPKKSVDLLFLDPPYNMSKKFSETKFNKMSDEDYYTILETWIKSLKHTLKPTASIYICGDWSNSGIIYEIIKKHFILRNRITWEREKGRGAKTNWKNCSEDIWFCTMSNDYYFNVDAVKIKKKVIAPYKNNDGSNRDWETDSKGNNFRLTYPSNLWTDLTVPFWSMPENTDHPTQKPEKLLAKILLASSKENDVVLDPFLGSGTTAVVCKKLNRIFIGIEKEELYACYSKFRVDNASSSIQGYNDGIFEDRNRGS